MKRFAISLIIKGLEADYFRSTLLNLPWDVDVAEEVVSNRPYRLRGELVAKNVIPKATFDEIKGRITASP